MKKLLFIIFIICIFSSCSEKKPEITESTPVLKNDVTYQVSLEISEPKIYTKGYVSKNFSQIYTLPQENSNIATEVFLGEELNIIAEVDSWFSINFNENLHYIKKSDVSFDLPERTLSTLKNKGKYYIQDVPVIPQEPEFPTGCESVCAVMALNYLGEDITVADFVDNYLDKSFKFYTKDGLLYGPDPFEVFVGDPRLKNSYGCMSPVIENALNKYFQGRKSVKRHIGIPMQDLCAKYIDNDIPVLVWVTIAMIESFESTQWETVNGTFIWPGNEHCMLLVGYDKNYYYMNDPYKNAMLLYPRSKTETRYAELGSQAIVIVDKDS